MPRRHPASVRRQIVVGSARVNRSPPWPSIAGFVRPPVSVETSGADRLPVSSRAPECGGRRVGGPPQTDRCARGRAGPDPRCVRACSTSEAVVPPKRRRAIAEGLIARGHSARSACRITGLARSLLQYHRRRPVPDREVRRLIVADTITEIHQRSRGTYGRRRVRAALLADYDMNVNHKLVNSIMSAHGLYGLPRPGRESRI